MTPFEIIAAKRDHLARLANENGALGEQAAILSMERWQPRPKGLGLRNLLAVLPDEGITIKLLGHEHVVTRRPASPRAPRR